MVTQARLNVTLYLHTLILHLSLFMTSGVARESYWSNLGRGCKSLKKLSTNFV